VTQGAYTFTKVATGYDVVVTPAPAPQVPLVSRIVTIYGGAFMGGGMILVGLLSVLAGGSSASGGYVALLLGAAVAALFYFIYERRWVRRQKYQRQKTAFSITPTELRVADRAVAIADIHRFIVSNPATRQEQSIAASAGAGAAVLGEAAGAGWNAKVARVLWRVDVEAGGQASPLGSGLDQASAHGLVEDTLRKIAEIRSA
jgi:multisubunit Na+/H+ antiporter MnhB subunit